MPINSFITVLFVLVSAPAIWAQTPATNPCTTMSNQQEITECAIAQYNLSLQTMDRVYQQVLLQAQPEYTGYIRTMHETWKNYLGAACNCEAFPFTNTPLETLVRYQCLSRLTNDYIQQLQQLPWEMPADEAPK